MSSEAITSQKHRFDRPESFVRREGVSVPDGLVIICGCAGSGKTVFLSQLAEDSPDSVCVSFGSEDNSQGRIARILSGSPVLADKTASLSAEDRSPVAVLNMTAEYLSEGGHRIIIDNADLITDAAAASLLYALAKESASGSFGMILAARRVPDRLLPLVMEGKAALIGAEKLRFDPAEVRTLVEKLRPDRSDAYIYELYAYTGGWCAAVSALLRSDEEELNEAVDNSYLPEYAERFIADPLDAGTREFLLYSAFLQGDREFYSAGLGLSDPGFYMIRLIRLGIAADNNGVLTYPEVMRHIFSRMIPADERKSFMERASDHYVSCRRFAEAIRLFEVSGNASAAERILSIYGDRLLSNCEFELIGYCGRIIGGFENVKSAEALGALAQYYYYIGEYDMMEQAFNAADVMFGKENRFSVLRKLYKGLLRFELKPELYTRNVLSAVAWLNANDLPLPFLYSREQEVLDRITSREEDSSSGKRLYVRRFGGLRLAAGEQHTEIQCRTKRSAELIAYMLEHSERPAARDELLNAFWPEDMPANAVAMLHNMIYHLRRELSLYGLENVISYKNKYYSLDTSLITVEDGSITEICRIVRSGDASELEKYDGELREYWGAYLGTADSPWANEQREYYDRCYVSACTMLSGHYRSLGKFEEAAALLKSAARLEPYSEQIIYDLLSCYSSLGKPDKARSCYEDFSARIDAEFGTRPGKWLRNHFFSCFSDEAEIQ